MPDIIMSVQDIIDAAFLEENNCTVNFRLLKILVVIIANQLRVLNRHVQVNVDSGIKYPEPYLRPSLEVSEVKIQVDDENKKRNKERKKELRKRTEAERSKEGERKNQRESKERDLKINGRYENIRSSKSITPHSPRSSVKYGNADEEETTAVQKKAAIINKNTVDDLEELREREIRTINQRADSHEEPVLSPCPMISVHSMGKENLLIVSPQGRTPRLNVVTKDQFDELVEVVRQLEAQFDPIGVPGFPENAEFLKALRSGASLTDAMAALQMSARLQAFEKAFVILMSLLTDLAKKTPGVEVSQFQKLEANFARDGRITESKLPRIRDNAKENESNNWVSREEFNNAMHELYDEVKEIVEKNAKATHSDKKIEILAHELERKVESLNYGERMEALEAHMSDYAEKFINLDIGLSTQIAGYQEQLTQMQYQLETGIENMLEKVAHVRSDPEALLDFNVRLESLQQDVENAALDQRNLKGFQDNMTLDLARLWKETELIHEAKADRDEVEDALRDKAGIRDLNGMVMLSQFNAALEELKAKISSAHQKFNDQEYVWQAALDDFTKAINEKTDYIHTCALRDDVNQHLNNLRDEVDRLIKMVGLPRAAALRKKLFSDTDCACCGTPAEMNMGMPVPKLSDFKRALADGAESPSIPTDDGDHGLCIPEHPIPHSRDTKSHMCHRFCGGSHTLLPPLTRPPPDVTTTRLPRIVTTTIGSDGKAYKTDEWGEIKPCERCNIPKPSLQLSNKVDAPESTNNAETNTLSFDMSWRAGRKHSSGSTYPTMPFFDDNSI